MRSFLFFSLFSLFFSLSALAQKTYGGYPIGLIQPELIQKVRSSAQWEGAVTAEVRADGDADPLLISHPQIINWQPASNAWQYVSGRWVYIGKLHASGAAGAGIILDQLQLEPQDRIFFYDTEGKVILGTYRAAELMEQQRFFPGLLPGSEWVVEVSRSGKEQPNGAPFRVARIDLVPREKVSALGFDDALPCEINVACPEGDGYRDQERSAVRILMVLKEGMGWCSGSLLNNTARDGTPYILTAFHCQDGYTPEYELWRFDFEYQSATCDNPAVEPSKVSYTGAQRRAGFRDSDFLLLELSDRIAPGQGVWFSGWNRSNDAPSRAALIHHPAGDIKKISLEENGPTIYNASLKWNNGTITPKAYHFQAILDKGTMEPGSSGAPFFDQDGYLVGQLHGGNADCDSKFLTYHGRFMRSWTGGGTVESRLTDWLDPVGTAPVKFRGMENPDQKPLVVLSGRVQNSRGVPLANVTVKLEGVVETSVLTGPDGEFTFAALPAEGDYRISASKDDFPQNGVTAQDVSIIRRHLLGITSLTDQRALVAADANGSGTVTASDLIPIIRLILGLNQQFPARPSWIFEPEVIEYQNLTTDHADLKITGIKIGDVNFSADPRL